MKNKLSLLLCALVCSFAVWADCVPQEHTGDYVLRKNGNLDLKTYKSCDVDNQYQVLDLALVKSDALTVRDMVFDLESGGASANFTADPINGIICNVDGTYDIYIKPDKHLIYIGSKQQVTPEPEVVYTVVGEAPLINGANWNPENTDNDMVLVDGVLTLVVKDVTLKAQGYQYKFISNHDWNHYQLPQSGNFTLNVEQAGKYDITYTLDVEKNEGKAALKLIEATPDQPQPEVVYSVVGEAAILNGDKDWDVESTANDMQAVDGVLTLVVKDAQLEVKEYSYKFVGDHKWGGFELPKEGNLALKVEQAGKYDITYTLDVEKNEGKAALKLIEATPDQPQPEVVYSVVGEAAILNGDKDWDVESTANDLQAVDGVLTLVVKDAQLEVKEYSYKFVGDHKWGGFELPKEGNLALKVEQAGKYDITYTLDVEKNEGKAALKLLEADTVPSDTTVVPQPEVVYTVVGEAPIINGANWDPTNTDNDMALVDGVLTLVVKDVALKAQGYQYKFISNHDWDHYQLPLSGNLTLTVEQAGKYDVTYTLDPEKNEGKAALKLLEADTVPSDTTVVPQPEVVYSVVGEAAILNGDKDWDVESTANDLKAVDGVLTLVVKDAQLEVKEYSYKFVGDHKWGGFELPKEGNFALKVEQAGKYDITYTLDVEKNEGKAALKLLEADTVPSDTTVVPQPEVVYSVVGEAAILNGDKDWDVESTANDLQAVDGVLTLIVKDAQLAVKEYSYKFVGDHKWGGFELPKEGNFALKVEQAGKYEITYTLDVEKNEGKAELKLLEADTLPSDTTVVPQPEVVYTVVGEAPIINGANWDPTNTDNDMALVDGVLTLVVKDVALKAQGYQYKFISNHDWDHYQLPLSGNLTLTVEQAGKYDVTYTLDPEKNEGKAELKLLEADTTEQPKPEVVYSVVGEAAILNGDKDWDVESTANDMSLVDGVLTLVVKDAQLLASNYSYKFVSDHKWGAFELPKQGNLTLTVEQAGKYDITYTLDPEKNEGKAELTLIEADTTDHPQPEVVYSVVGEAAILNGDTDWDVESTANDMSLVDGVLTLVVSEVQLDAKDYSYKFVSNHKWGAFELPQSGNLTLKVEQAGKYNITYTLDPEKNEGKAELTRLDGSGIDDVDANYVVRVEGNTLVATAMGQATISIYGLTGQMIDSQVFNGQYTRSLNNGMYIIRIGDKSFRAIVR